MFTGISGSWTEASASRTCEKLGAPSAGGSNSRVSGSKPRASASSPSMRAMLPSTTTV